MRLWCIKDIYEKAQQSASSFVASAHAESDKLVSLGYVVLPNRGDKALSLNDSIEVIHNLLLGDLEAAVLVIDLVKGLVILVGNWRWTVILLDLLETVLLCSLDLPFNHARLKGIQTR
jgi:hypothetical protein